LPSTLLPEKYSAPKGEHIQTKDMLSFLLLNINLLHLQIPVIDVKF